MNMAVPEVEALVWEVFVHASCIPNPGAGGYAFHAIHGDDVTEFAAGEADTTNNRMEIMAEIAVLETLPEGSTINLHSDSQYVADGVNFNMPNWKQQGWKRSDGKAVMNQDLWQRLDEAMRRSTAEFCWQPKDRRGATRPNLERDKYGRKRARVLAQVEAQKQKPRNKGPIGRGAVR